MHSESGDLFFRTRLHDAQNATPRKRAQISDLTSAQRGIWFAQQLNPTSPVYNVADYLEIRGPLDQVLFERALRQVVAEAETLHFTFADEGQGPQQKFSPQDDWRFPIIDCAVEADPQAVAKAWMRADLARPLDLSQGPLFSFALFRAAPDWFLFYYRYHHIISDGTTRALIAQRLAEIYSALVAGQASGPSWFGGVRELAAVDAEYHNSDEFERDRRYWIERFGDVPTPVSLSGRRAPGGETLRRGSYLSREVSAGLRELARSHETSLPRLLVALISIYLYRLTEQADLVIGFPVAARGESSLRRIPGMAANVIALRLEFDRKMGLDALLHQVDREITLSLQHQRYRFEALRKDLGLLARREPLFTTSISVEPFDYNRRFGESSIIPHNLENGPAEDFNIFAFARVEAGLELCIHANAALYSEAELDMHLERLAALFQQIVNNPTLQIGAVDLIGPEERRLLLEDWNRTEVPYPQERCIHELFEDQVRRTPDAVAVVFGDERLSYGELNARANRLARHLRSLGVRPDDRVAICVERSLAMVVGLLGVLKAGGGYVPLDPAYPVDRLAYMLEDSGPAAVLTHGAAREALAAALAGAGADRPVVDLEVADMAGWAKLAGDDLAREGLTSRHLAYVIYTSGSTGQPKGVVIEHCNLVNQTAFISRRYGLGEGDRVLQFVSFAFDVSVEDIFASLICGAAVVVRDWRQANVDAFFEGCRRDLITMVNLPAAFFQGLVRSGHRPTGSDLRRVTVGGEAIDGTVMSAWFESAEDSPKLFNAYGPTEATVCTTLYEASPASLNHLPIGRPIWNTRLYVLDGYGEPVPVGVAGELWIGGAGVARGYLNRPELTAERFIESRFVAGDRLYRTGDLVRYLPDGNLEFLGRNDFQVKIRGFRIELGEIEARLVDHPGVREAVVLAREDALGEKRLVAYVVPAETAAAEDLAGSLRGHLQGRLPDYMVPTAYVALEALPLTPNGKLDRRALPAPAEGSYARRKYEAPQGAVEERLAGIWQEVLGVERVGRHDSFFELGGHSLLAIKLAARTIAQGMQISVNDVFIHPTIVALAACFGSHTPTRNRDVVPVRPTGSQHPLFLVHEVSGLDGYYSRLAEAIEPDIPIWGLLAVPEDRPQLRTIEAMAERLIRNIRSVQAEGPYRIAGYSFGGVLAYEAARQLSAAGHVVGFLGLIDTAAPEIGNKPSERQQTNAEYLVVLCLTVLDRGDDLIEHGLSAESREQTRQALRDLLGRSAALPLADVLQELRTMGAGPEEISDAPLEQIERLIGRLRTHVQALPDYAVPAAAVPTYLFAAQDTDIGDPWRGWGEVLQEPRHRRIAVPGNHQSIMGTHRAALGRAIMQALFSQRPA